MKYRSLVTLSLCLLSCNSIDLEKQTKESNVYYKKAISYRDANQVDSAFLYFIKAEDLAKIQRDSLTVGKSLVNLAILYTNKGDYLSGQEFSFKALTFLKSENKLYHGSLSSNYNNLGIATQNLRDYQNAVNFYDTAIRYTKDTNEINLYLNNKGYVYQLNKQYDKALEVFSLIQKSANRGNLEYTMALANTSFTKWQLDRNYNPLPELFNALQIRKNEKDEEGLNSSYSYLSDYYTQSNPDSALFYAHKMYSIAKKLATVDDQLYALQKLIKLSPVSLSKKYFDRYLELDDSAQIVRNEDKNRFALIRYRVEENKAENLKLQEENITKKYQLIVLSLLGVLFLISGILWYKKRKQRIQLEAENAIRENQFKTSKKVHDVVANGLYRVMTEIENQQEIDKENLLDKIEDMYEKSRDISYEKPQPNNFNFHEKIDHLILSFTSSNIEIKVTGNTGSLWKKCNKKTQDEVEHIIQELMVNMKKHSQATQVEISFQQSGTHVSINYKDNGIGMPKDILFKNGLSNTGNRIKSIFGDITFDQQHKKGLAIHISFPFS